MTDLTPTKWKREEEQVSQANTSILSDVFQLILYCGRRYETQNLSKTLVTECRAKPKHTFSLPPKHHTNLLQ